MLRRLTYVLAILFVAFAILFVSVFRTASVRYNFPDQEPLPFADSESSVIYSFPNPGRVLPGSLLWTLKVIRDQMWLVSTTNPERHAELLLLFSDKRLVSSVKLMERGETELAITTLSKAEKYLERSLEKQEMNRQEGRDTREFYNVLITASLKHAEIIEAFAENVTGEAQVTVLSMLQYPKRVFIASRDALLSMGETPPDTPEEWR